MPTWSFARWTRQDTKQIFDFHDEGKKQNSFFFTATAPLGIHLKTNLPYTSRCYIIPYIFGLSLLVLVLSTVYHEHLLWNTKYIKIGICCFLSQYAALRCKSMILLKMTYLAFNNNHPNSPLLVFKTHYFCGLYVSMTPDHWT